MADEDLLIQIGLTEKKYLAALARLDASTDKATKGLERKFDRQNRSFVRGIDRANQSASAFANGGLKQIGMQLSQVAQQGAVTGSYLQAMTVQAADIGLAFGTVGIAAGALISVLGPMALGMMGVEEESEKAGKAVDSFVASMQSLQALSAVATGDVSELRKEFGELADEVQRGAQIAARAALSEAMSGMGEVGEDLNAALRTTTALLAQAAEARKTVEELRATSSGSGDDVLAGAENELAKIRGEAEAAAQAVGLTTGQAVRLHAALTDVGSAKSMEEVASAAQNALNMIDGMFEGTTVIPPEVARIAQRLQDVLSAAARGSVAMDDIADSTVIAAREAGILVEMMGQMDLSGVGAQAAFLAQQMGIAAAQAVALNNAMNSQAGLPTQRPPGLSFGSDGSVVGSDPTLMPPPEQLGFGDLSKPQTRHVTPLPKPPKGGGRKKKTRTGRGGLSPEEKAEAKAQKDALREVERYVDQTRTAVEEYHHELAELQKLKPFFEQTGNAEAYARAVAQVEEEFRNIQFAKVHEAIESVSDAMASAIVNGEDMGEALRGVFQQIAQDLIKSGIQQMLMGLVPGGKAGGTGFFGKIFAGLFDGGGSIPRGQFGIAGENGPEIIRGPAHVTSTKDTAKMMQGGGHITVGVDVDNSGNLIPLIRGVSGQVSVQTTAAGIAGARKNMPGQMQSIRARGTS